MSTIDTISDTSDTTHDTTHDTGLTQRRTGRHRVTALVLAAVAALAAALVVSAPANAAHEAIPAPNAPASPWHLSESWALTGSYYGEGAHTERYNDYYAQDWTKNGSAAQTCGARLYPIYDGMKVTYAGSPTRGRLYMTKQIGAYTYGVKYLHMKSVNVRVGQIVNTSTLVGYAGQTNTTGGCHLHIGVHRYKSGVAYSVPPKWCGRTYADTRALQKGC